MGRGVALAFKEAFPENFKLYAAACKRGEMQPGRMFVTATGSLTPPQWIINFPTKRDWKGKSRIEDIESGLKDLVRVIEEHQISSVALPPLGSGLGGLKWEKVRPLIEKYLRELPSVEVTIYEPRENLDDVTPAKRGEVPPMTTARAVVIAMMRRYLSAMLDPNITLLELHKLLYFMEVAGQGLSLHYQRAPYGPYAENLRHLLDKMNHYYIKGFRRDGDAPTTNLELLPGSYADAEQFLAKDSDAEERLRKVFDLIDGWESPHGLELLSTVLWISREKHPGTTHDYIKYMYEWGPRKKQFTERQIELAVSNLAEHHWITFQ